MTATLEQPEDRHLASSAAPTLALAVSAEITLVDFDLALHRRRIAQSSGDELA